MFRKGRKKNFGFEALISGALAFVCLFVWCFGPKSLVVVSRTEKGNSARTSCWGYKVLVEIGFFTVLGVPDAHVQFCTERCDGEQSDGKGKWAKHFGITHAADDLKGF